MDYNNQQVSDAANLLYGSYIRYDRMYEMSKFAFYGKTDSNEVNIFIDLYSIFKILYSRWQQLQVKDSYSIASCAINLAIHLRAYFESRHNTRSKVYLIYGGARPREAFVNYPFYNNKNIVMEDQDSIIKNLIADNLNVMQILCPYLYDIFCIVDMENEFSVVAYNLIDLSDKPNIIYSKEPLAYQLVAFRPFTFLYRPKKRLNDDISWVVTKSTIYNAYRYGELKLKKEVECNLNPSMFSIYQAISGLRSRNMNSIVNANSAIKLLSNAVEQNIFSTGYNVKSIFYTEPDPLSLLFPDKKEIAFDVGNRLAAIDINYQAMLYKMSINSTEAITNIINLYDPQEIRNINDKYFSLYPLDLNRV